MDSRRQSHETPPRILLALWMNGVFGQEVVAEVIYKVVAHRAAILAWLVVSLRWMDVPIETGAPGW